MPPLRYTEKGVSQLREPIQSVDRLLLNMYLMGMGAYLKYHPDPRVNQIGLVVTRAISEMRAAESVNKTVIIAIINICDEVDAADPHLKGIKSLAKAIQERGEEALKGGCECTARSK